ncbi:lipid storage droplets surface-binding protein 2 [Megalopta genalis]|uniref:lipid storage droplets surface-binding protein 2 n=1 Tax=Megalopta genalis TaxID=115081 RepID=UPI001443070B|nr:lipid storage droplets surface-binding protein 2-like [Megalopta genalis]XP_033324916.1 lipid storage droplets surface-binding protein 2-like [Megalopta genalis]
MTAEVAKMPHMEIFYRLLELPVVESALSKSAEQYTRVRDSNPVVHWILTTAESSLSTATNMAVVPIAAPIARKLETPIQFVDHTLCFGLDKIEEKVPMVKEKPEQILENAYMLALQNVVQPAVWSISHVNDLITMQASNLKDVSWNKANQILGTHYGSAAVKGLDNTAVVVDKLIDRYFPATGDEESIVIKSAEEDKLLHTLQTVGRLSNKAARRVYANIVCHMSTVRTDNIKAYIGSVLQFLQLTRYLHSINDKERDSANAAKSEKKQN